LKYDKCVQADGIDIFFNFSNRRRMLIKGRTRIKMKKRRKPMKVKYNSRFFSLDYQQNNFSLQFCPIYSLPIWLLITSAEISQKSADLIRTQSGRL
jgi:hypothetical protein